MKGKVDFIVCEEEGGWYIESLQIPPEIATQSNQVLVQYAKEHRFNDEPDIVYIGVYWRDQALDEMDLTTDAAIATAYDRWYRYGDKDARN